jgi:predicted transcriptional regulator
MTRKQQSDLFTALKPYMTKTVNEIALITNYSEQMIRNVLRGNSRNELIIETILNNLADGAVERLPKELKNLLTTA